MIYSLAILFFSHYLVCELKGALIMHSMVNIWQKSEYGLRVKPKEKYLYNWKCNISRLKKVPSQKFMELAPTLI